MSVKVVDLANALAIELQEYCEEAAAEVKAAVRDAAKGAVEELKRTSPKDTGEYAAGWKSKVAFEDSSNIRMQVYQDKKPQLTHLLEDGHAKVNGGRVEGRPHIGPAAAESARKLEHDVPVRLEKR